MNREESIFCNAIEIREPDARGEYLFAECGDDAPLRQRVERLLEMHYSDGRLLDETTDGSQVNEAFAEVPMVGQSIGPYKLLQEIGDGGMGVVFMAEQSEPVRRKVAVKVIKVGMDTRSVVARFESERQAMAMMDHPCITKVLDAGATDTGRPYFVMELVHGKSVTSYCDEKRLPLRKRLEIFSQICNAVEHAHQKGIIHRDIKPTNVMVTNVDGQPLTKIIDFGIAKATSEPLTDKTMFTRYGEMIGTPLYMSPEQAEMSDPDVDTRSDIYSLGVLLYELMTGTTPFHEFKKERLQDIRDAIRSRDPQLASTRINSLGETSGQISRDRDTDIKSLHRTVRGDLDWIVMKCLARDRNHRYQSAGELSREIERFLAGEPVEAAAPTVAYRTRKFISRYKWPVTVAAMLTAILAAGTIVSTALAIQANKLAQRATKAEQLANMRLQDVVKERDRAIAAEQRLAKLERRQRNQIALQRAAAIHNATVFKEHLADFDHKSAQAGKHKWQIQPMSTVWTTRSPDMPRSPLLQRSAGKTDSAAETTPPVPGPIPAGARQFTLVTPENELDMEFDDIEVFVDGDSEMEKDLAETILASQQQMFGNDDVVVVGTLKKLGQLAAQNRNWEESERYYRQAMSIVEKVADEQPQLSELRIHLANVLENQGNLEQAVEELKEAQKTIEEIDVKRELNLIFDKVKSEISRLESRSEKQTDDD